MAGRDRRKLIDVIRDELHRQSRQGYGTPGSKAGTIASVNENDADIEQLGNVVARFLQRAGNDKENIIKALRNALSNQARKADVQREQSSPDAQAGFQELADAALKAITG